VLDLGVTLEETYLTDAVPTFSAQIYSPRWGHNDTYEFVFERDTLKIIMPPRIAICNWQENSDPAWSGEPLEEILRNDCIYPPSILQDLIEHLWTSWRNGDIPANLVNAELQAVITWVNQITEVQPQTEFWSAYF
jgi:hypothetical protein